ncbi:MAG: hypothetical protein II304_05045 [Bacteroidales bacterium]|nr:hypothetical protein [Bacteroidales bacterium]
MKTTKDNIEVILFDYAEGNLSPQERKEVEAFLENNPQYKQMLSSYKDCKGLDKPLDVKFEEKDELFTLATGKKAKSIVFVPRYMKYACSIAAMILLFFAIKPLLEKEVVVEEKTPTLIAQKKAKKNSEKAKNYFEKSKKKNEKAKENFTFVIEDEQDSIIHQIAFQEIELPSAEIEKQERILYMRYEESIMVKKVSKPSLVNRIVKSIGLEEKIEEFYDSDFVSNTRNAINTARSLGKKLVKTTTTTIKREESINV